MPDDSGRNGAADDVARATSSIRCVERGRRPVQVGASALTSIPWHRDITNLADCVRRSIASSRWDYAVCAVKKAAGRQALGRDAKLRWHRSSWRNDSLELVIGQYRLTVSFDDSKRRTRTWSAMLWWFVVTAEHALHRKPLSAIELGCLPTIYGCRNRSGDVIRKDRPLGWWRGSLRWEMLTHGIRTFRRLAASTCSANQGRRSRRANWFISSEKPGRWAISALSLAAR